MEALVSHLIRLENYRALKNESRPLRVLVAEDDTRMAHLMVMSLKQLGHNVVGAADNGEDLVELTRKAQPDLLIVDLLMPRMNGFEALEEIQKEFSLPVIVSSGRPCSAAGAEPASASGARTTDGAGVAGAAGAAGPQPSVIGATATIATPRSAIRPYRPTGRPLTSARAARPLTRLS